MKTRSMNDNEFDNFLDHVKCPWVNCAGSQGLSGIGFCSFRGEWDNVDCPQFIQDQKGATMLDLKDLSNDKLVDMICGIHTDNEDAIYIKIDDVRQEILARIEERR